MIPTNWAEGVEIKEGVEFLFPSNVGLVFSKNCRKYKGTPFILYLLKKKDGRCYLPASCQEGNVKIFVDKNVLPGTKVYVEWYERRCASVRVVPEQPRRVGMMA